MKQWARWQDLYLLPKWWSIAVWLIAILFYLTLAGCKEDMYIMGYGLVPGDKEEAKLNFPLIDRNNVTHDFLTEYNIGIYDEDVMYCASHHKWETIKAIYNIELDIKQYDVRELPKQW